MAKPLKIIGMVAGAVAIVASGGAALGLGLAVGGSVISAGTIATFASLAATAANIGATLLQKPPPARGSVTDVIISHDPPQPYAMGEGYVGGVIRHDAAWGPTLKKVPNPYRAMAMVLSGAGPVQSLSPRYDQLPVAGFYTGFLWTQTQLGATPEASALSPQWAGMPGWGASAKLSGQAAIMWSFLFDKDGKRFASGIGELGGYGQWVKVYDPRKDSTFPGGVGAHRLGNEATYEWSENPALHFGTYAYGRYQNGKRVMGAGLRNVNWANIAAWANVCDANNWTIFGRVFEPGDRFANLKEIAAAGGGQPIPSTNGLMSVRYHAPVVMLDTIRPEDLTGEPVKVTTMASWSERLNTIIPKGISPDHEWKNIAFGAVVNSTFLADDGEEKVTEWPFNLVKGGTDQLAQLAAYKLFDSRELNPIVIPCGPRMRHYRAGDGLRIELPDYDLETDAVVLQRRFNPATLTTYFILMSETPAKHPFALGRTTVSPPTPALGQTAEERDELAASALNPSGIDTLALASSYPRDLAGNVTQAHVGGGEVEITIPPHTRVYGDGRELAVAGTVLTRPETTDNLIYYDDPTLANPTPAYTALIPGVSGAVAGDAYFSATNPSRHFVARVTTVDAGGTGGSTGGSTPPGGGGWSNDPDYNVP